MPRKTRARPQFPAREWPFSRRWCASSLGFRHAARGGTSSGSASLKHFWLGYFEEKLLEAGLLERKMRHCDPAMHEYVIYARGVALKARDRDSSFCCRRLVTGGGQHFHRNPRPIRDHDDGG